MGLSAGPAQATMAHLFLHEVSAVVCVWEWSGYSCVPPQGCAGPLSARAVLAPGVSLGLPIQGLHHRVSVNWIKYTSRLWPPLKGLDAGACL